MSFKNVLESSRFHFVGIGGIGMCGLAELLSNMGAQVSGSDLAENAQTMRLKEMGISIFQGHTANNVGDIDVLVYSSAVKMDNPEVVQARSQKIPVIRRAEALAEIMRLKRGIAIAGTHGKTTTTSLTASVFIEGGADPTAIVGGRLDLFKSTAKMGKGEWLIAEADESDGSFQRLSPEIVVVTNIDSDHLDYYGTFEVLQKAFFDFASSIPFYGLAIVCGDDPTVQSIFKNFDKRFVTYGFQSHNNYQIQRQKNGKISLFFENEELGEFLPKLPGDHNALNAAASLACARETGVSMNSAFRAIEQFQGVDRRFQFKGSIGGIDFYDDYGHHPTEVQAVLKGFRDFVGGRPLKVLFQPHRYSRTQLCWEEFMKSFHLVDEVYVTEIYPAGEKPIDGISGERFTHELQECHAEFLGLDGENLTQTLLKKIAPGDVFLTLGAGNVYKMGESLMLELEKRG